MMVKFERQGNTPIWVSVQTVRTVEGALDAGFSILRLQQGAYHTVQGDPEEVAGKLRAAALQFVTDTANTAQEAARAAHERMLAEMEKDGANSV